MATIRNHMNKWLPKRLHQAVGRFFCKRSIIIVSEHKTQHVPFAIGMQMVVLMVALVLVGAASFFSGSYVAAQKVLAEKDRKIAMTSEENERFAAEFSLLKRDLITLSQEEKSGKPGKAGSYAQMIAERYAKEASAQATVTPVRDGKAAVTLAASPEVPSGLNDLNARYAAVFQRIDYLENKVKELQTTHQQMVADIKQTTAGKIAEIERVIASTGVDKPSLVKQAELQRTRDEQRREKYGRIEAGAAAGARGGPFEPLKTSALKEKEPELYFSLKRMMTLNELVNAMPLSFPLDSDDFHVTSTFGTRSDPFRGTQAFHAGVDIAGPQGARITASSDGKIVAAGWHNAYGNTIDVDHGYGFVSRYGHLSKILVRQGQTVKRGQVIAIQGSTGRSTGSHLHYEVRYNDEPLNPSKFLKAGVNVRAVN